MALLLLAGMVAGARGNSIVVWGTTASTNIPAGLTNTVALAGGTAHNLALLADGTVRSWGSQTNVPRGLSNVIAIAAGGELSMALKHDGRIVAWGVNYFNLTNIPTGATNVVAISAGASHCLALQHGGTVIAWGDASYNQTNVPAAATNVASISAGGAHSAVLREDGAVVCWGINTFRQVSGMPPNVTNVAMVAAGADHTIALHRDGSHTYWGIVPHPGYSNAPTGISNVVAISGGLIHTTSLLSDGTVRTDGYPGFTNQPPGLSNVIATTAAKGRMWTIQPSYLGGAHSLALLGDGFIHAPALPELHTVTAGSFRILSARATGPQPLYYQWRLNGIELPNATRSHLVLPKASRRDAGEYSVIISSAAQSVTCQVAQFSVAVRQRLEIGGVDESGNVIILSGDEDGTHLMAEDLSRFTLEGSPDCLDWVMIPSSPSLTNGRLRFADALGTGQRFYRVREILSPAAK